jgi:hypothetical protein
MKIEQVAQVCHEANRAFCLTIGDESQPAWSVAPAWQRDSAINGVKFHLAELEAGREPQPSASHENWLKEKAEAGWKYGVVKDAQTKEHPCFVPYRELPPEQKQKDFIFVSIVKAFWNNRQRA